MKEFIIELKYMMIRMMLLSYNLRPHEFTHPSKDDRNFIFLCCTKTCINSPLAAWCKRFLPLPTIVLLYCYVATVASK